MISAVLPRLLVSPLWLIVLVYLALATGYSLTTPLLETPDEVAHYEYVREIAQQHALPAQTDPTSASWAQENHQPPLYYVLAGAATSGIDASNYSAMVRRNPYAAFEEQKPDNRNIFLHGRAEFFPWQGAALGMHIARVVSVLLSALAVVGAYFLSRELFPARLDVAIGSAAFVAFLPQFDFIAGAVSNDGTVTAMCALGLAALARVWQDARNKHIVWLGGWLSLAALSKASGMLLWGMSAGVLGLEALWRRDMQRWRQLVLLAVVVLALTGWWFARNQLFYNDWLGIDTHLVVSGLREPGWGFGDFIDQWNEIEISFWGLFGAGNVPLPQPIYDFLHLSAIVALLGVGVFAVRSGWRSRTTVSLLGLLLWVGVVLAFFYRWNTLVVAPHGRLLFPALSAIALLWFVGLSWFVPGRWRIIYAWGWAAILFVLSAFALAQTVPAAYPMPAFVSESSLPRETLGAPVRFGDELELGAFELPDAALRAGDRFDVVLYWLALDSTMQTDYTVTLQMFARDGQRIAQLDTFPVRGMYPTSQWQGNQWLRDTYSISVARDAPPGPASLIVGLYDRTTNKALQVAQPDGRRAGRLTIAQLEIR